MRIIKKEEITEALYNNLKDIGYYLDLTYKNIIKEYYKIAKEKQFYSDILENEEVAIKKRIPLCQDTGSVIVYAYIGDSVYIDGNLNDICNEVVKKVFEEEKYRMSIVDGKTRANTKTNTPISLNVKYVSGDKIEFKVMLKGAGSENQTFLANLSPMISFQEIKELIVKHIQKVGAKACPPYVLGVSIGGTSEQATVHAKELLFNSLGIESKEEKDIKDEINRLNIGPIGTGGLTCAKVNLGYLPSHMASNFLCINICCSAMRKKVFEI